MLSWGGRHVEMGRSVLDGGAGGCRAPGVVGGGQGCRERVDAKAEP